LQFEFLYPFLNHLLFIFLTFNSYYIEGILKED